MRQINKILLITFTIFSLVSCIKEIDLYDNSKENDEAFSYLYPFAKEAQNTTAEIIFHTNEKIQVNRINANVPYLKYNKSWLCMLTQDDCKQAAYCRTWAVINGKPISSSTRYPTPTATNPNDGHELYYDAAHLRKGDLPPTIIPAGKTLGYTDGTGKEVRYAFTTTLSPEEKWMSQSPVINLGFTGNYYRFYMKSGLIWNNVIEMLNYGTGIAFHDVKTADVNNPAKILEHYIIAQDSILKSLSGRGVKMLAEPNGNKTYVIAALQYPEIKTITAQTGTVKLYPFQVTDDLKQSLLNREFNDYPDYFKNMIKKQQSLPKEEREAIHIGVHGTDNAWMDFLRWLNDTYGKDGDDSVWFPSQEEYYEYNYYRIHGTTRIEQIDDKTFKLTVTLPSEQYFYYPSVTVNLKGLSIQNISSVNSNDVVTGLSYGNHEDGIMLNIDCRKFLVEHATHYVELYEKDKSNKSNKADARYFVNMLKESEKKEELSNRIK